MSNNKQSTAWLIFPLLTFVKCTDGKYQIIFGWLNKTFTFKFNNDGK
jgi:hypothetical protein